MVDNTEEQTHAMYSFIAELMQTTTDRVEVLRSISLDQAIATLMPSAIVEGMVSAGVYTPPIDETDIDKRRNRNMGNLKKLRAGEMDAFFKRVGGEAGEWYEAQMASNEYYISLGLKVVTIGEVGKIR